MDSEENKRLLWERTNHIYKPWMDRAEIIKLFETTVQDVDQRGGELQEKNQIFMREYPRRVEALMPATAEARDAMFEERAKSRLAAFQGGVGLKKKTVTFEPEADDAELWEIRRTLADTLARLDAYLKR